MTEATVALRAPYFIVNASQGTQLPCGLPCGDITGVLLSPLSISTGLFRRSNGTASQRNNESLLDGLLRGTGQ